MQKRMRMCSFLLVFTTLAVAESARSKNFDCGSNGALCTEVYDSIGYGGVYTGHDEPSLLFYSNVAGSGNTGVYLLKLPKDPPILPKQDGTGGTFNFQLHPAFWVGMAVCDDQSAPNPGGSTVSPNISCTPDSDTNIYDGSDPTKPDYIGKHPGTAFMEMQFYPPGWFPFISCDTTNRWCSALNIDSLSENMNTGIFNNSACENAVGDEPVNFAFITKSGVPGGPPSPLLQNGSTFTTTADTLFYNPGDVLLIILQDTAHGLKITITDLNTHERGSMTASAANSFAQVKWDPNGTDCNPATHNLPSDFHPIYSTSSEHTRVPWAAHSYNIAFSDEIGHFEYCNAVDVEGGTCTQDGIHDLDNGLPSGAEDDFFCFDAAFENSLGQVPIGGCVFTDFDFDGVPYQFVWPGTFTNKRLDRSVHPQPVRFTSPLFTDSEGERRNYNRVAFEVDLPRIESATNPPCQRHISNPADPHPGQGCVNPPTGANFYPLYTTTQNEDGENCIWQLGGAHIPGTINTFGGTSTTEFGPLLASAYPAVGGPSFRYNNFRKVLNSNPCPAQGD
jgi:hypothetical protein